MLRILDISLSAIVLVILLPLFLIIALMIKLDSQGPVLYRATRTGKGGRPFSLYKFRSMVQDAAAQGPGVTAAGDTRVTRVGAFLRQYKFDELPQFVNVLKGDMSLVGPRPEDPRYVALYTPEQRQVLAVRPGITSAASLRYRHEERLLTGADWETTYRTVVMPEKLAVDLAYLQRRTLTSDLRLIGRTVLAMFESEAQPLQPHQADLGRSG